jgi:nucleoside-diphosphate-sugar epimerase
MVNQTVNPLAADNQSDLGQGRVLVLGGGYTGQRFAHALSALGIAVRLSRRLRSDGSPPATSDGLEWLNFDGDRGVVPPAEELEGITHVLVTIPPDRSGGDPVLTHLGEVLGHLPLRWIGYLSTTGVYGDTGGAWVDENAPTPAGPGRSQARLQCEAAWRSSGLPLQVFRLPAIYGPGRSPFAALASGRGRLIHKPGQVFCRIHVDDIVGALLHCLALDDCRRPELLNLADDCPSPSSETLGFAAHLLDCPLPEVQRFENLTAEMSPMALSFWNENRRVSNLRLKQDVGYSLRYPSYREGYRAVLAEERRSLNTPDPLGII